jgi:alpha-ribazole phosphatase
LIESMIDEERWLDLIRHGEAAGGAIIRGHRDDPLTSYGWLQLHESIQLLTTITKSTLYHSCWDVLWSSPSQRCYAFAQWWSQQYHVPVHQHHGLLERDFGAWDGQPLQQLPLNHMMTMWTDPAQYTPPRAETFVDFCNRVENTWHDLLEQTQWHHALIVTHGGVIRILIGLILGIDPKRLSCLEVPLASITRLRIPKHGLPSLVWHGLVAPHCKQCHD